MNQPSTIQAKSTQHGIVPGADIVKFEIKNMYKFSVARLFQNYYRREMRKKFSDHFFCRSAVLACALHGEETCMSQSLSHFNKGLVTSNYGTTQDESLGFHSFADGNLSSSTLLRSKRLKSSLRTTGLRESNIIMRLHLESRTS